MSLPIYILHTPKAAAEGCSGAAAVSCQKDDLDSAEKFTSDRILLPGRLGCARARGNAAGAGRDGDARAAR